MKQFVIFIIFHFMLFYYEKQVSGTAFNNQFGDMVDDLEGLTGGRGKLLKGQLNDPNADRNVTRLDVYAAHLPSSTSTKSLVHFAQLVKSKKFRRYDYGSSKNLKYYQQEESPDYDLSSITTPVALFWSSSHRLVDPEDVAILRRQLKTVVFDYRVRYPYNHFDFAIAKNAREFLYKHVLQLLSIARNIELYRV